MNRNWWVVFLLGMIVAFCVALLVLRSNNVKLEPYILSSSQSCVDCTDYKVTRDELSRQLNSMKREYGRLNCEMKTLQGKMLVSDTGGWCKDASSPNSSFHMTDVPLAKALSQFFLGKSVGSFGDGPGKYKLFLDKTGLLARYDAYDGAPYCAEVTNGVVKFLDLTAPQYGLPVYDWVMSLEVAEHIPAKYERIYMDNIVRHAKDGIVLSWAVPTQVGHSHVNGKSFKDVKDMMANLGFRHDEQASKNLRNAAKFGHFRRNVNVFHRIEKTDLSTKA